MEEAIRKAAEESVVRRYQSSLLKLEETIRKTRVSNDKLSQQLFTLNNRTINVAEKIGFHTFEELEEAVLNEPAVWNAEAIKANHKPAVNNGGNSRQRIPIQQESSALGTFRDELEVLKRQVMQLQHRSNPKVPDTLVIESPDVSKPRRVPLSPLKSVGNSSPTDKRDLRTELRVLSRKYDALVVAKKAAEKKYKEDYRRWKSFKSWLLNKSKHAKALRAQIAEEKLDFADDLRERENSSDQDAPFASSSGPASLPRSMQGDDSGRRPSLMSSSRTLDGARSKPGKTEDDRLDNCVARVARPESYTLKADGKRKAQSSGSEIPAKIESVEGSSRIKEENPSSRDVLGSSTKKRGRYSDVADVEEALNALFEIDTSRNNGLPFQFDEVVRGRKQRHQLEAGDCDCCREYYECVEPLPSRPGLPLWESLPPADEPNLSHRHHRHSSPEVAIHHRQQISRHRHQWSPAKTPPDYWNIGFPTTQEAADINRRAADMHAQKRRRVEEEAGKQGGRYVRRKEKEPKL